MDRRVILIAGPTASGKSALALELSHRLGRVIINADSMQVYDGLRLITARPSPEEEAEAPHRLYGTVDPGTAFSTGDWLRAVKGLLAETTSPAPILVGGTGLYYKALTEGFAEIPEIKPEVREACRELANREGAAGIAAALCEKDPEAARELIDLQRLTRALEVVESTGRRLSDWQNDAQSKPLVPLSDALPLVLSPPRPWLHDRIAQRGALMLGPEGCAEVSSLLDRHLDPTLPAMRAIGVREVSALLSGSMTETEALEQLVIATRQYAKRQETWFRNQMSHWCRIDPSKSPTRKSLVDAPVIFCNALDESRDAG